ncbi:MAG: VCBS repeat-containing protein [Planctomycetes bacterium]|nr:VCBS repeat-containing protein [Planctomycetota bacterium]
MQDGTRPLRYLASLTLALATASLTSAQNDPLPGTGCSGQMPWTGGMSVVVTPAESSWCDSNARIDVAGMDPACTSALIFLFGTASTPLPVAPPIGCDVSCTLGIFEVWGTVPAIVSGSNAWPQIGGIGLDPGLAFDIQPGCIAGSCIQLGGALHVTVSESVPCDGPPQADLSANPPVVVDTVALVGGAPAPIPMAGAPAGAPMAGPLGGGAIAQLDGAPLVNAAGQLLYHAEDSLGAQSLRLLDCDGTQAVLVATGDAVAGLPGGAGTLETIDPASILLNDAGDIAFRGTVAGVPRVLTKRAAEPLSHVVTLGPGNTGLASCGGPSLPYASPFTFTTADGPYAMNSAGSLVLEVSGTDAGATPVELLLRDEPGTGLCCFAWNGLAAYDGFGSFAEFLTPSINDAGEVVFFASTPAGIVDTGWFLTPATSVVRGGSVPPILAFLDEQVTVNALGSVAYTIEVSAPGSDEERLETWRSGVGRTMLDRGSTASPVLVDFFDGVAQNAWDQVLYRVLRDEPPARGWAVVLADQDHGTLTALAAEGTGLEDDYVVDPSAFFAPLPDDTTASYAPMDLAGSDVTQAPIALNDARQAAFVLALTTGERGLWATYRDGEVTPIAVEGYAFEVAPGDFRTVSRVEVFPYVSAGQDGRRVFNDRGDLAFRLELTDGSEGVFLARIRSYFSSQSLWNGESAEHGLAADDMDGDGTTDVIVSGSDPTDGVKIYFNAGGCPDLDFSEQLTLPSPATGAVPIVATRSSTTDPDVDLLQKGFGFGGGVIWFENDGNDPPSFSDTTHATEGGLLVDLRVADLDLDGDTDIVYTASFLTSGTIRWLENTGGDPPTFSPVATVIATTAQSSPDDAFEVADVTGDGYPDVLFAEGTTTSVTLYVNPGSASPQTSTIVVPSMDSSLGLRAAQIDGASGLDLVFVRSDTGCIQWLANDGSGNFGGGGEACPAGFFVPIDVDSDGYDDLVADADPVRTLKNVLLDQPLAGFGSVELIPGATNSTVYAYAVADVDGDGRQDLVLSLNGVQILLNNGGW